MRLPGQHDKSSVKHWRRHLWQVPSTSTNSFLKFTLDLHGGGGHCLVWIEESPAGWSVCLPLLIFPCTIKSTSSLLAPAHPGGRGKKAVKRLWCGVVRSVQSLTATMCGCLSKHIYSLHYLVIFYIRQIIFM